MESTFRKEIGKNHKQYFKTLEKKEEIRIQKDYNLDLKYNLGILRRSKFATLNTLISHYHMIAADQLVKEIYQHIDPAFYDASADAENLVRMLKEMQNIVKRRLGTKMQQFDINTARVRSMLTDLKKMKIDVTVLQAVFDKIIGSYEIWKKQLKKKQAKIENESKIKNSPESEKKTIVGLPREAQLAEKSAATSKKVISKSRFSEKFSRSLSSSISSIKSISKNAAVSIKKFATAHFERPKFTVQSFLGLTIGISFLLLGIGAEFNWNSALMWIILALGSSGILVFFGFIANLIIRKIKSRRKLGKSIIPAAHSQKSPLKLQEASPNDQ